MAKKEAQGVAFENLNKACKSIVTVGRGWDGKAYHHEGVTITVLEDETYLVEGDEDVSPVKPKNAFKETGSGMQTATENDMVQK